MVTPTVGMALTKQGSSRFPDKEALTGRQEVLTKVLVLTSELSSESEKMFELLQIGVLTPDVRGKVTGHLFNINLIVRNIEDFLGIYRQVYSRDEGDPFDRG